MADTTEGQFQVVYQEIGGNINTWGTILNTNLQYLVQAIGSRTSIAVTGGTTSLTDAQQRFAGIKFTGTLTSNQTVKVNDAQRWFYIENATSGAFTLTVAAETSGVGVTVPQGEFRLLFCDGTDVIEHKLFDRSQVFSGLYASTVGGTADAITLTVSEFTDAAYAAGQTFIFVAGGTNTTNVTINVNTIGAAALLDPTGAQLPAGTIQSGGAYLVTHDGTQFVFLGATVAQIPDDGVTGAKLLDAIFTLSNGGLAFDGTNVTVDLNNASTVTDPQTADLVGLVDTSAANATVKVTLANLLKVINSLTEDTSPDESADFILTYDTDADAVKKVKPANLQIDAGWDFLDGQTASGDSEIDFTLDTTNYSVFKIILKDVLPSTDGADLIMQWKRSGQGSFDTTSGNYKSNIVQVQSSGGSLTTAGTSDATTAFPINTNGATTGIDASGSGLHSEITIIGAADAGLHTKMLGRVSYAANNTFEYSGMADGSHQFDAVIAEVRFLMDTGNINGEFELWGLRNS